jgi:xylulokinase
MYRAALEALGYTLFENLDLFRRCGFPIEAVRAIGGGAKSDVWLQMMADITGLRIERPAIVESALLGAAIIAAVGSGAFSSLGVCSKTLYSVERIFTPRADSHALYEKLFENYVGLYRRVYHHPM